MDFQPPNFYGLGNTDNLQGSDAGALGQMPNMSSFNPNTAGSGFGMPGETSPDMGAQPPAAGGDQSNFDWNATSKMADYYGKLAQPSQGADTNQTMVGNIGMGVGAGVGAYFGGAQGAQVGAQAGKMGGALIGGLADHYDQAYQKDQEMQEAEHQKKDALRRQQIQEHLDQQNTARANTSYEQQQAAYRQQMADANHGRALAAQGIVHNFLMQNLARTGVGASAGQNEASLGLNTTLRGAFG